MNDKKVYNVFCIKYVECEYYLVFSLQIFFFFFFELYMLKDKKKGGLEIQICGFFVFI